MADYFTFWIYTPFNLSAPGISERLWNILDRPMIAPRKFDTIERARKEFSADSWREAAELYKHYQYLCVKGGKAGFTATFHTIREVSHWGFYISTTAMQGKQASAWIDWIASLCEEFPIFYGSGSTRLEYQAKHQVVERTPRGGQVEYSVGVSAQEFSQYLPGIYWITIFGPELTAAFGLEQLSSIPHVKLYELASGQSMLRLDEPPAPTDIANRLVVERNIARQLGADHFFDRDNPTHPYRQVAALAAALEALGSAHRGSK